MDVPQVISQLEARAAKAGITINELCRRAEIARSTFTRMKAGDHSPNTRTLEKLETAVAAAEVQAQPKAAA